MTVVELFIAWILVLAILGVIIYGTKFLLETRNARDEEVRNYVRMTAPGSTEAWSGKVADALYALGSPAYSSSSINRE